MPQFIFISNHPEFYNWNGFGGFVIACRGIYSAQTIYDRYGDGIIFSWNQSEISFYLDSSQNQANPMYQLNEAGIIYYYCVIGL